MTTDDDHTGHDNTDNLNESPDTHPTYEDRAYGGAGRDVLIGNTGGDRLIDWVGEYNSYIVPYAPFGMASVSRTMQPFLPEFLYALSAGDGADPTRADDTGADPLRNGEPEAELGLVKQKDFAWQDQTGAPSDPQAGNIPGGPRDVLRSANFNSVSSPQEAAVFVDTGSWKVENGTLRAEAAEISDTLSIDRHRFSTGDAVVYSHGPEGSDIGGLIDGHTYYVIKLDNDIIMLAATFEDAIADTGIDLTDMGSGDAHTLTTGKSTITFNPSSAMQITGDAVSVFHVDEYTPNYFEIQATIATDKPKAGWKANAYIIFDYQSPEDFKFAGINISNDQIEMGYRDASGWHMVEKTPR
jgi:hypothetical protein